MTSVRLTYIKATAALAMAERLGRISPESETSGRAVLDELRASVDVIEDHPLMVTAARLARTHAFRGYDATHCAAGLAMADADLAAASGETRLIDAWRSEVSLFTSPRAEASFAFGIRPTPVLLSTYDGESGVRWRDPRRRPTEVVGAS